MRKIIRERLLTRGKNRCAYCLSSDDLQIDHIIPVSRGGREDEDNMQILCKTCNLKKGAKIDIDKYFIKGDGENYLYIRNDIPLNSFTAEEFKHIVFLKIKEHCNIKNLEYRDCSPY